MTGILVQDWIEGAGGAEKVLAEATRTYPDAEVACLWNDAPASHLQSPVRESVLARTPIRRMKSAAVPFMAPTWRHMGQSDAEWILAFSHLFAHHARFSGNARDVRKFAYVYTPARYIWSPEFDDRGSSTLVKAASIPLRVLDRHRAQELYNVSTLSKFVRDRIWKAWRRDSEIIYPPVEVSRFSEGIDDILTEQDQAVIANLPHQFYLGASRFTMYKRLDLVIKFGAATNTPVVIAGDGPDSERLRSLARRSDAPVQFVKRPSTALLRQLYIRARAFVFPAVEDFGIMPVEAMATGTPVIGRLVGGVAETVIHGETGLLLQSFDHETMRRAHSQVTDIDSAACRRRAHDFDSPLFRRNLKSWIDSSL